MIACRCCSDQRCRSGLRRCRLRFAKPLSSSMLWMPAKSLSKSAVASSAASGIHFFLEERSTLNPLRTDTVASKPCCFRRKVSPSITLPWGIPPPFRGVCNPIGVWGVCTQGVFGGFAGGLHVFMGNYVRRGFAGGMQGVCRGFAPFLPCFISF